MSEKDNMLAGLFYNAADPELVQARQRVRRFLWQYNATDPADETGRAELLKQILGKMGNKVHIEPPFFCDYGTQIELEENVCFNFNCVILDCAKVTIGANTQMGPNVQIYTATHPLDPTARAAGREFAAPVTIGKNVWIGGGAIILPNIKIGDHAVVGAGAVVTHDVPAYSVVGGSPAKLIRQFYESSKNNPFIPPDISK